MAGIREESGVLLFVNKGDAPKLYTPSQVKVGGSCTGGRGGGVGRRGEGRGSNALTACTMIAVKCLQSNSTLMGGFLSKACL